MRKFELSTGKKYLHIAGGRSRKRGNMQGNTDYEFTRGATGSRIDFELYDDAGAINLNFATVFLTLKKRHTAAAILDAPCFLTAMPSSGKSFYIFDGINSLIPSGTYQLKIKVVEQSGRISYFPTDKNKPFGAVIVLEAI